VVVVVVAAMEAVVVADAVEEDAVVVTKLKFTNYLKEIFFKNNKINNFKKFLKIYSFNRKFF
jgi:hypothetical protein